MGINSHKYILKYSVKSSQKSGVCTAAKGEQTLEWDAQQTHMNVR